MVGCRENNVFTTTHMLQASKPGLFPSACLRHELICSERKVMELALIVEDVATALLDQLPRQLDANLNVRNGKYAF